MIWRCVVCGDESGVEQINRDSQVDAGTGLEHRAYPPSPSSSYVFTDGALACACESHGANEIASAMRLHGPSLVHVGG